MSEQQQVSQQTKQMFEDQQQGSSKSTANPEKFQSNEEEVEQLMASGNKLMLSNSYEEAVNVFSDSVKLATKYFGDFAPQSFTPYFNYGKALIEVARLETFPFKAPVDNIDESEEGEDESGEDEDQQLDLQEILMGQCKKGGEAVEVENKGKKEKKHEQEESKEEKIVQENGTNEDKLEQLHVGEKEKEEKQAEDENCGGEDDEELGEDEAEDIQIAWEILEIARKICDMQIGDGLEFWEDRKADVMTALGDCMSVAENFTLALNEFTEALEIRKKLFGTIDRRVSESYFWIARTHKYMNNFKLAAEVFGSAKKVLEELIEAKDEEDEREELKELVKGVEEQIQDALASAEQEEKRAEFKSDQPKPEEKKLPNDLSVVREADDVTELIKRKPIKRPADGGGIGEAKEMKLAKTFEEVQNGETKVAEGKTNGHEKAENGVGRNGGEGKTMTDG